MFCHISIGITSLVLSHDNLVGIVNIRDLDMLAIVETWLEMDFPLHLMHIPDYQAIRQV